MTKFLPAALLFLALAPCLRAGEPNAEQFKAICAVAQDMDHSTMGLAYEDQFKDAIQDRMRDALKACASHAKPGDEVNLVIVLAADGKVEHIFADPGQPVSACVGGRLERARFPTPPKPPPVSSAKNWMELVNIVIKE